jgi:hypothetical protein
MLRADARAELIKPVASGGKRVLSAASEEDEMNKV